MTEERVGLCPRPVHLSPFALDARDCWLCHGTNRIPFKSSFPNDDAVLVDLWAKGMNATTIAIELGRPVQDVVGQAALLKLEDPHGPEPLGVSVRPFNPKFRGGTR